MIWVLVKGASALLTGEPLNPGGDPLQAGLALAAGAFLLFWLSIWTLGGIAAIAALFQMLWAEDRLIAGSGGLTPVGAWTVRGRREFRAIGFARSRWSRRAIISRCCWTASASRLTLGTPGERKEAAAVLRAELAVPAAPVDVRLQGMEEIITPEEERAVVSSRANRRIQARVALLVAAGMSVVAFAVLRDSLDRPALLPMAGIVTLATAALILGAVWLSRGAPSSGSARAP